MANFTVVLPCLNEQPNLVEIIPELDKLGCEIIISDSGSTDGGPAWLRSFWPRVRVVQGSGTVVSAILRGLGLASFDKVVIMDSDQSHPPSTVPALVKSLETHDLVVASRYCNDGSNDDCLKNRIISRGFNLLSFFLAPSMSDRASGFWAVRKSAIEGVRIRDTTKPALEFIVRGRVAGLGEIPYGFKKRGKGEAKLGKPILREVWSLLLLYFNKYQRLLKFCLVGGVGTSLYLGILLLLTEVVGLWYLLSALSGIAVATLWNYTMNSLWTFGDLECSSCDYEWRAWYKGSIPQKWWKRDIGKKVASMCGKAETTLDLGCGSSPVINLLPGKVVGLDRSKGKLDFLQTRTKAELRLVDFESVGWDRSILNGDRFDCVVATNVLEHVSNPSSFIGVSSRVLNPGGSLVVTVPDYSHPLTGTVEALVERFVGGHLKDHKCKLTLKSLITMAKSYGLTYDKSCFSFTDRIVRFRKGVE